jgi:hypothetical protein
MALFIFLSILWETLTVQYLKSFLFRIMVERIPSSDFYFFNIFFYVRDINDGCYSFEEI